MKAIAYIRVSTADQAENGHSLNHQEDRLRAYCQAQGLDLHAVIRDEGISAGTPFRDRPGGKQVMAHLLGGTGALVVLKLDRIFRNTVDCLTMMDELNTLGIHFHCLDFGGMTLATNTAMGQFMLTMRSAFAQLEKELTRERTRDALQHKRRKGQCVGQVPFGYTRQGDDLVEHPRRQRALELMYNHMLYGCSLRQIADFHNSDFPELKVSAPTVKRLLTEQQNRMLAH